MSASSKKQQRKAEEEAVITSRAQEEQAKAAQRKRNTLIYSIIAAVVIILAAILLIWDSGVIQRNATAATIDGEKVTPAQVAYYYHQNPIISTAQSYSMYGLTGFPYDPSVSPKAQVITPEAIVDLGIPEEWANKTYHEYFADYALNSLREEAVLLKAAKAAGCTLSEEAKTSIDEQLASIDATREQYLTTYGADMNRTAYLQMVYGKTMTQKSYLKCLENALLAAEFYDTHFEDMAVYTAEELDAYYQANVKSYETISYYWRQFSATVDTDEGETVDEEAVKAAAKADADAALAKVQANPELVKDNEDYTLSTGVLTSPDAFYYDWLTDDARQVGDSTVLDTDSGYYVMVFNGRYRDETPTVNVRHILVAAANEDDPATADVDESTEAPSDEAFAAAEKKAQDLLAQWKAGEATEDSFAALVADNSADVGSNSVGGLYENVFEGRMISTFNDWIFDEARQAGDTGIVKNTESSTQGWHIIYFVGHDEPVWVTNVRQAMWAEEVEKTVKVIPTEKLDLVAE